MAWCFVRQLGETPDESRELHGTIDPSGKLISKICKEHLGVENTLVLIVPLCSLSSQNPRLSTVEFCKVREHLILRTCNEPWQPLVFWGLLRSIFRAKRSSALSSSCQCRPDARTKDTHFRRLSFPSARNVQSMVHCPLCYRRKGSHSWPLASCFRRTTLLRKDQGLQPRLIPYA